jgi:hypothetical protein
MLPAHAEPTKQTHNIACATWDLKLDIQLLLVVCASGGFRVLQLATQSASTA